MLIGLFTYLFSGAKTRQFIQEATDFLVRGALQRKHPDLVAAVESEVAGLNGLQFLDVARELEILVQSTVLRPLHAKLTDDLERCGNGYERPAYGYLKALYAQDISTCMA